MVLRRQCSRRTRLRLRGGERPLVALRVAAAVAAVPEGEVDELLEDLGAFCLRAVMVCVDISGEHVRHRCAADCGRVAEARRRLAGVDRAAQLGLELEMQPARGAGRTVGLAEAEGAAEELGGGLAV